MQLAALTGYVDSIMDAFTAESGCENNSPLDNLMTVKAFVKRYPGLEKTDKSLRWEIDQSDKNRLDEFGGIERHHGRVYINIANYTKWMIRGGETDDESN
jgi:hypothetical protein